VRKVASRVPVKARSAGCSQHPGAYRRSATLSGVGLHREAKGCRGKESEDESGIKKSELS